MDKEQLRDMRAIVASEVRRSAPPKLAKSVLAEFERRGWVVKDAGVYKSTEAGRAAVLAAGQSR